MIRSSTLFVAVVAGGLAVSPFAEAAYINGFTWNRAADWTNGSTRTDDAEGNEVWSYVYAGDNTFAAGWPIPADATVTAMTYRTGGAAINTYAPSNTGWPRIGQDGLSTHAATQTWNSGVPMAIWTNPTGSAQTIEVSGSLSAAIGYGASTKDIATDLNYALVHISGATSMTVFSGTLAPAASTVIAAVDVDVAAGDALWLMTETTTHSTFGGGQTGQLVDSSLNYVLVPEPATLALLGVGGLCLMPRRRTSA